MSSDNENKAAARGRYATEATPVTAVEYGLIAALIAVALLSGVPLLGSNLNKTLVDLSARLGH